MSARDQMRAMIDQLMGSNADTEGSVKRSIGFESNRVCRPFLLGCCPFDILSGTRVDMGYCSRLHDLALKSDYEKASETRDFRFDIDAFRTLDSFIRDTNEKAEAARRKLLETQDELGPEASEMMKAIHELSEQIGVKLALAEELGADGKVEESFKIMNEVEDLKREKIKKEYDFRCAIPSTIYQQYKLRVCEVCSAYLGIHDNDRRLADHFGGKLHLGFIRIRERYADLKKKIEARKLNGTYETYDDLRYREKASPSRGHEVRRTQMSPNTRQTRKRSSNERLSRIWKQDICRSREIDQRKQRSRSRNPTSIRDYEQSGHRDRKPRHSIDHHRLSDSQPEREAKRVHQRNEVRQPRSSRIGCKQQNSRKSVSDDQELSQSENPDNRRRLCCSGDLKKPSESMSPELDVQKQKSIGINSIPSDSSNTNVSKSGEIKFKKCHHRKRTAEGHDRTSTKGKLHKPVSTDESYCKGIRSRKRKVTSCSRSNRWARKGRDTSSDDRKKVSKRRKDRRHVNRGTSNESDTTMSDLSSRSSDESTQSSVSSRRISFNSDRDTIGSECSGKCKTWKRSKRKYRSEGRSKKRTKHKRNNSPKHKYGKNAKEHNSSTESTNSNEYSPYKGRSKRRNQKR